MIVIITKSFQMKKTIDVELFNQTFQISHKNSEKIKGYTNRSLSDILQNPSVLNENVMIDQDNLKNTQHDATQDNQQTSSNFVVFVTSIDKSEVQVSFEGAIQEKLHLVIIQKIPPHIEEINILKPAEIIRESVSVSSHLLIGKY